LYTTGQIDRSHFAMLLDSFAVRFGYLAQRCQRLGISFDPSRARNYSLWPLECKLCAHKLTCTKHPSREPLNRIVFRALRACLDAELPISNRLIRAGWFLCVAVSPHPLAKRLISIRFAIKERPPWFEGILSTMVNITAQRRPRTGK